MKIVRAVAPQRELRRLAEAPCTIVAALHARKFGPHGKGKLVQELDPQARAEQRPKNLPRLWFQICHSRSGVCASPGAAYEPRASIRDGFSEKKQGLATISSPASFVCNVRISG